MTQAPSALPRTILGGIGAGLLLALADWAASGLGRTPATLVAATLGGGIVLGTVCGLLAASLRRRPLAPALVLAVGMAAEGLSSASKELSGDSRPVGIALAALLALAGLVLAARRARPGTVALALAALPAASWLAARATDAPWIRVAAAGVPLIVLTLAARGPWLGAVVVALVAAQAGDRSGPRPELPPLVDAPAATGPDVVLLVIDTLRADEFPEEGALARIARGGVAFHQCISAAPWTLPSVGSLLTGLYPSQHGALAPGKPLADDVSTLAELLRARGYATAAFTGGAFVGTAHRLDRGFEHFDPSCERRFAPFRAHPPLVWRIAKNRYFPLLWLVRWVDESVGFDGVARAAEEWCAARRASGDTRPFFLFLHTYQVHDYYLYDPTTDDGGPAFSARFADRLSVHPAELTAASQEDLDAFRARYRRRVAAVDARIPELERDLGAASGALVWAITADHGEGFDHALGRVHHGGRLHDDLLRVPLVLAAPGRLPAAVVEAPVRTIDVLPTLLDLCAVPLPDGLAGESLLPALRGERDYPAGAFAEERAHGLDLLALRRAGTKLIRGNGRTELYDLAADPRETAPLDERPPAEVEAELEAFSARHPGHAGGEVEIDDATREELRDLGYVR